MRRDEHSCEGSDLGAVESLTAAFVASRAPVHICDGCFIVGTIRALRGESERSPCSH
jgi:hypothetical protein